MNQIRLGQLVSDGITWAIAQEDSHDSKVLVKFSGITELWDLSDIEEIEDREIIKVLRAAKG